MAEHQEVGEQQGGNDDRDYEAEQLADLEDYAARRPVRDHPADRREQQHRSGRSQPDHAE